MSGTFLNACRDTRIVSKSGLSRPNRLAESHIDRSFSSDTSLADVVAIRLFHSDLQLVAFDAAGWKRRNRGYRLDVLKKYKLQAANCGANRPE